MDKALLLALIPLITFVLLMGVLVLHIRRGKKISLRLEGLGVKFSLVSGEDPITGDKDSEQ